MTDALQPIAHLFDLNTRLFRNCLDGVTDAQALRRPNAHTNHLAFVALHLVDARHFLLRALGADLQDPFDGRFADARRLEDIDDFPSLDDLVSTWDVLADLLEAALDQLTREDLMGPAPQRFPIGDPTVLGEIAFLAQHEAYHIGQMALIRKYLGLPAMRYGRP